jgi:predicted ATPase
MANLFFISGTHGSGKTTLINELKKDNDFVSSNFKLFDSYTRSVYSEDPLARQIAIIATGVPNYREKQNTIFNRSLVDTLAYTRYLVEQKKIPAYAAQLNEKLLDEVKYLITHTYVTLPDFPLKGDDVRSSDEQFQTGIHFKLLEILKEFNISYTLLPGSVAARLRVLKGNIFPDYNYIQNISKEEEIPLVETYFSISDEKLKTFCLESYLRGLKYKETQTAFLIKDDVHRGFIKYRVEGNCLILSSIATLPAGQNQGTGTELFSFIKRKVFSSNLGTLKIFVDKDAESFYRKQNINLDEFSFVENERGSGWEVILNKESLAS